MDNYRMIDIKDIAGFTSGFASAIYSTMIFILTSVRKYFIVAIVSFAVIASAALLAWRHQRPVYEAYATFESINVNKKCCGEMIKQLDDLIRSKSYKSLATALGLSETQVAQLLSIDGRNMAGSHLYEDITNDHSPMYIYVKAKNNMAFQQLQNALLRYLNTNIPYQARTNQIDMETAQMQQEMLQHDLSLIDTVVLGYSQFLKTIKPVKDSILGFTNISALISYKQQIEDKLVELEWKKRGAYQSVEVYHGFIVPDNPSRGSNKVLAAGLICALIAAFALPVVYNLLRTDKQ